jgi:hypothetical protein
MSGRHRRPPAWRRLLLRLRRSDRAARLAALQADVVALQAMVRTLRAELDTAWASAAAAGASARAIAPAPPRTIDLTLVPDPEMQVALDLSLADAIPALTGPTVELDLRENELVTEVALALLPESALLDPRVAREPELTDPAKTSAPATATPAAETARRTA